MNLATVFDGLLPASLNPGIDPGAYVEVWTPTVRGQYQVLIESPDEVGSAFSSSQSFIVDPALGGIVTGGLGNGTVAGEFQENDVYPFPSLRLATSLGHAVRVVVKVGLIVSPDLAGSDSAMIIPLEEIKAALGIEPGDDSEDVSLVQLEEYAAGYVENMTERRWRAPIEKKEYQTGNGTRTLFLAGHVEPADVATIAVREGLGGGQWNVFTEFEYRAPGKLVRNDSYVWHPMVEYEITYQDGWVKAPADIRALVLDLITITRDASSAEAGIKSETIGDYSYTLDSVAAAALTSLSGSSADTLNRRRAKHI